MTNIEIKYNPILCKTEIRINNKEIAKTCNLYRYRNTLLDDWVDICISELVEFCNDDEYVIEIISLQKYVDMLREAVNSFCKNNRQIQIDIKENVSIGYKGRLAKLNKIEKTAPVRISNKNEADMQVMILSLCEDNSYEKFIDNLFGIQVNVKNGHLFSNFEIIEDGFETNETELSVLEDQYLNMEMLLFPNFYNCSNKYWKILKERLSNSEGYTLIVQLNSELRKNDEFFDYYLEEIGKKGFYNKIHFLFFSENKEENYRYLKNEYGLRNFLMVDEEVSVIKHIRDCIESIGYIEKIRSIKDKISIELEDYYQKKQENDKRKMQMEVVEQLKDEFLQQTEALKQHYNSLRLEVCTDYISPQKSMESFVDITTKEIREFVYENYVYLGKRKSENSFFYRSYYEKRKEFLYDGSIEKDVEAIFEKNIKEMVKSYLEKAYFIRADKNNIIDKTAREYKLISLINDYKLEDLCSSFVKNIRDIKKRTEYHSTVTYFVWLTENISAYECEDKYFDSIDKKINRRLKTIEKDIISFFESMLDQPVRDSLQKIIEKKIKHNELLIDVKSKEVLNYIDEMKHGWNLSAENEEDTCGLEELIHEVEECVEV
ncbi:hypothetical protein SAMN02910453_1714 [Lachnospiraceae bacterium A10]|nr:hypothetical protein SAMN02910453_1714 [Lachnospiraceae bacterium A10]